MLFRDNKKDSELSALSENHLQIIRATQKGITDPALGYRDRLLASARQAIAAPIYRKIFTPETVAALENPDQDWSPDYVQVLSAFPLLEKRVYANSGFDALALPIGEFLHYYESSGTTGDPMAAPKASTDLIINTMNIGELWARVLKPDDIALILINAPFAPASYQFEKVLEYLGIMSFRPWVDNVSGDYSRVIRLIEQLNANVFVGPPSRLLQLIQFANRQGRPAIKFDRLLLMAEQTGPSFQRHLERLTGGKAFVGTFGSSETGTTAVCCEHNHLHLQTQSYIFEIATDQGILPLSPQNNAGELVVTTLDIPARPLIRYRSGDRVKVDYTPCACGLAQPVLVTQGRASDVICLRDSGVRQDDLEHALWHEAFEGAAIFNYLLILHGRQAVVLVTTDYAPDQRWASQVTERLAPLFVDYIVSVKPVDELPPLASLGQFVGWKLSRVLDLNSPENWQRLPEPILGIVKTTLAQVEALLGIGERVSP